MKKKMFRMLVLAALPAIMFSACAGTDSSIIETITGTSAILATGGTGSVSGGGNGAWYMETFSRKGVTISRNGTIDAAFSVPAYRPLVSFGTNSATISTNTTVTVLAADAVNDAGPGVLYMVAGFDKLYLGTGLTAITLPISSQEVTGLKVDGGRTLTLGLNIDTDLGGGMDTARVTFTDDVDIAGALKTADLSTSTAGTPDGTALDMGGLDLSAHGVFIHPSGSVITRGLNGTAAVGEGGNGGYVSILAGDYIANEGIIDTSGGTSNDTTNTSQTSGGKAGYKIADAANARLLLTSSGAIINRGRLVANGGSGANGGDSCTVKLDAGDSVYNTGLITADGGTGHNGLGGNTIQGWELDLFSATASVFNSGGLSALGGNGTSGGGSGGFVNLVAVTGTNTGVGDLINSGIIRSNGGNATTSGIGGSGGTITFHAHGAVKETAYLTANGGEGMGAGNSGGDGGSLFIRAFAPVDAGNNVLAVRPIQIGASLSLNGGIGRGSNGGQGGYLEILQDDDQGLADRTLTFGGIYLYGYAQANLSAGSGTAAGGSATLFTAFGDNASMEIHTQPNPDGVAGPITNEINITIRGGNASGATGAGGDGGSIAWDTNNLPNQIGQGSAGATLVNNTGKIDLSAGFGHSGGGGTASGLTIRGDDGVTNSGLIYAKGGDSSGGTGGAGAVNSVTLESNGNIINTGLIDASGGRGNSGGAGSSSNFGGGILLSGGTVATPGSLTSNGGAGTASDGANGNGGTVELRYMTKSFGIIQVSAGKSRGAKATNGTITIDGQPYQPI